MTPEATEALLLVAALGLRHGLDPDHVAAVDGLALRCQDRAPDLAPWVGAWFALGHGSVLTAGAVACCLLGGRLALPPGLLAAAAWLPVGFLVALAVANLRALGDPGAYRPVGVRAGLVPERLARAAHPVAFMAVGALFAIAFDTATQAAAWGTAAALQGGVGLACGLGVAFTAGMAVTDGLDGRLATAVTRRWGAAGRDRYRRRVGAAIAVASIAVAAYSAAGLLAPACQAPELLVTLAGAALVASVGAAALFPPRPRPA